MRDIVFCRGRMVGKIRRSRNNMPPFMQSLTRSYCINGASNNAGREDNFIVRDFAGDTIYKMKLMKIPRI